MLTQVDLKQFTGTNCYYQHWSGRFAYTDGVRYVASSEVAYWLIDAIASYQPKVLKEAIEIQFWKLRVNTDRTAQLICERDTDDAVLTQEIEFTDFPLETITFYLTHGVLMLPSEY